MSLSKFALGDDLPQFEGSVRIHQRNVCTGEIRVTDFGNMVMTNFGEQAVYLIGGENLTTAIITRIALGTNATAETVDDTAITGANSVPITTVTYSAAGESPAWVQFSATFGTTDGNGTNYEEVGLLFAGVNPNLAARKAFGGSMTKTQMWEWTVEWKLKILPGGTLLDNFRTKLLHLIAGDVSGNYVTQMQFGTGTASVAVDDVHLQSPITPAKTVLVDHPTVGMTRITAYLLDDEANGFTVAEAGLLTGDGTLVGRKVFAGILKESRYILGYRWSIAPHV